MNKRINLILTGLIALSFLNTAVSADAGEKSLTVPVSSLSVPVGPGLPGIIIPEESGKEARKEESKALVEESEKRMKSLKFLYSEINFDMLMFGSTETMTGTAETEPAEGRGRISKNVRGRFSAYYHKDGKVYSEEDLSWKDAPEGMEGDLYSSYFIPSELAEMMKCFVLDDGSYLLKTASPFSLEKAAQLYPALNAIKNDISSIKSVRSEVSFTAEIGKDRLYKSVYLEINLIPLNSSDSVNDIRILCEKKFSGYDNPLDIRYPEGN